VLLRGEPIKRAYLGLQSAPASPTSLTGAEVQSLVSGGPAERAGIKNGDVITRVDNEPVREPSDVAGAIADNKPGDEVQIQAQRDGSIVNLSVTLGTRPGATP
jgi:S1-C subfamily serine protease